MERRGPSFEVVSLIVVLCVGALFGVWYTHRQKPYTEPPQFPAVSPATRSAGAFTLNDLEGHPVSYRADGKPLFVILTAVGCGECRARIPLDGEAVAAAHARGLRVWNILVYSGWDAGRGFRDQFHPAEDLILCDPSGSVAVNQLGGSDASCWIMIDGQGAIRWQGPGRRENIEHLTEIAAIPAVTASMPAYRQPSAVPAGAPDYPAAYLQGARPSVGTSHGVTAHLMLEQVTGVPNAQGNIRLEVSPQAIPPAGNVAR